MWQWAVLVFALGFIGGLVWGRIGKILAVAAFAIPAFFLACALKAWLGGGFAGLVAVFVAMWATALLGVAILGIVLGAVIRWVLKWIGWI